MLENNSNPLPSGQTQKQSNGQQGQTLPPIPDKRYFTIGEVSHLCVVKPHVLRYWEEEFLQLNPSKRGGNRRYYRREDVNIVRHIRHLLYEQGYTITGARTQLAQQFSPRKANQGPTMETLIDEIEEVIALFDDE